MWPGSVSYATRPGEIVGCRVSAECLGTDIRAIPIANDCIYCGRLDTQRAIVYGEAPKDGLFNQAVTRVDKESLQAHSVVSIGIQSRAEVDGEILR
jgi:hypothetical protein